MDNNEKIKRLYQLKKEVEKSDNTLLLNQTNEVIKKIYSDYITTLTKRNTMKDLKI